LRQRLLVDLYDHEPFRFPDKEASNTAAFASSALAAGVTVFELARVMETSVAMIERHYGALLDGPHASIAGGSPRSRPCRSKSRMRPRTGRHRPYLPTRQTAERVDLRIPPSGCVGSGWAQDPRHGASIRAMTPVSLPLGTQVRR
jgi:hypothetical protein